MTKDESPKAIKYYKLHKVDIEAEKLTQDLIEICTI